MLFCSACRTGDPRAVWISAKFRRRGCGFCSRGRKSRLRCVSSVPKVSKWFRALILDPYFENFDACHAYNCLLLTDCVSPCPLHTSDMSRLGHISFPLVPPDLFRCNTWNFFSVIFLQKPIVYPQVCHLMSVRTSHRNRGMFFSQFAGVLGHMERPAFLSSSAFC